VRVSRVEIQAIDGTDSCVGSYLEAKSASSISVVHSLDSHFPRVRP